MKICKVRPNYSTWSACIATQEMFNVVDDCRKCSTWLMIAVDVNRIPILMNYCRSELDFGAVTMQWFKRTAKSPKYH